MTVLQIGLACADYDIVRSLRDGSVNAEGTEINFVTLNKPPEVHWRMGVNKEFDAAEMSLGSFGGGKARDDFPFVGFPLSSIGNFGTHATTSMSELESGGRRT